MKNNSTLHSDAKQKKVSDKKVPGKRKIDILIAMAKMLESPQWQKITTAALAQKVGFSEAALYRHYSGKTAMYSALIKFIDESLITMFNRIIEETPDHFERIKWMNDCLLLFAKNNRGLTRILTGEALQNEHESLIIRINHILTRIEDQWKIILREAVLAGKIQEDRVVALAPLLMNAVIGAWWRFSKSGFVNSPEQHWEVHWMLIEKMMLTSKENS